jgi:hypothetical protein
MFRKWMLLSVAACCFLLSGDVAADPGRTVPVLRLRTEYRSNDEGAPLRFIVRENVDAALDGISGVRLVNRNFRYLIKVYVKASELSDKRVFVEVSAKVVDPRNGKTVLYEDDKAGFASELSRLCSALVDRMDRFFLTSLYQKEEEERDEDWISRFFEKNRGREDEDVEIDPEIVHKRRMVRKMRSALGAKRTGKKAADLPGGAGDAEERKKRRITGAKLKFAADHPDKIDRIRRISRFAEQRARTAKINDPSVPEDAYRHVLWSYLLTKEFGAGTAAEITAAHEAGNTGNTPAEKAMDRANNAVGRMYAAAGIPLSKILQQVRNDPAVIREP